MTQHSASVQDWLDKCSGYRWWISTRIINRLHPACWPDRVLAEMCGKLTLIRRRSPMWSDSDRLWTWLLSRPRVRGRGGRGSPMWLYRNRLFACGHDQDLYYVISITLKDSEREVNHYPINCGLRFCKPQHIVYTPEYVSSSASSSRDFNGTLAIGTNLYKI